MCRHTTGNGPAWVGPGRSWLLILCWWLHQQRHGPPGPGFKVMLEDTSPAAFAWAFAAQQPLAAAPAYAICLDASRRVAAGQAAHVTLPLVLVSGPVHENLVAQALAFTFAVRAARFTRMPFCDHGFTHCWA